MFDVKLARDHSVVIVVSSLMALMTDQVPSVRAIKSREFVVWYRRHCLRLENFARSSA